MLTAMTLSLQALCELVSACMDAPPVQMHEGTVIFLHQHLLLTVQDMIPGLVSKLAFVDKVCEHK